LYSKNILPQKIAYLKGGIVAFSDAIYFEMPKPF
jgi:hypothetical protein